MPLTRGLFALVDAEDFERVDARGAWQAAIRATSTYATCGGVYLHALIAGGARVDHRNRNGLDCRKENLRPATAHQNAMNTGSRAGTSRFKGVSWDARCARWQAHIMLSGKSMFLGRYRDEAGAACAYDAKARELFGEFAYLNFSRDHLTIDGRRL